MIDVSYFQTNTGNTQIFQNGGTWQTWIKPRGAKMVNFFVVGAGGGGGGGLVGTAGSMSGGAGGGTAACTKLIIQASLLPDILYILPGVGGLGGIGGVSPTNGSNGNKSYVCLTPDISSISNFVCVSGTTVAAGGGAGTTTNTSTTAGETAITAAASIFLNLGSFTSIAGPNAGAGTITSANASTVTSFLVSAAGGNATAIGGGISSGGPIPTIAGTALNTSGTNGLIFYKTIFALTGGRGGGGGTTGGNGGTGALGTGGGGGGAGTTSAGNGGKGGDGFIIITTNF